MKVQSWVVLLLLVQQTAQARIEAVIGSLELEKNPNVAFLPEVKGEEEILISRSQYLISYNKKRRSPHWVAWKLEASDLGDVDRKNIFFRDYYLQEYLKQQNSTYTAVVSSEFTGTCFNRGHQVPSKDRTDTEENNEKTFITANILPQTPFLNQVIWNKLEDHSRRLVKQGKKLFIVAGPIYDEDFGFIGPHKDIPVPSKNFKIIFILESHQTPKDISLQTPSIAVIMPNVHSNGSKPMNSNICETSRHSLRLAALTESWEKYRVSVDDVLKATEMELRF